TTLVTPGCAAAGTSGIVLLTLFRKPQFHSTPTATCHCTVPSLSGRIFCFSLYNSVLLQNGHCVHASRMESNQR
ncbi:hypothetical protein LSAT2_014629, partial [Lamellibrachia satsuma]